MTIVLRQPGVATSRVLPVAARQLREHDQVSLLRGGAEYRWRMATGTAQARLGSNAEHGPSYSIWGCGRHNGATTDYA